MPKRFFSKHHMPSHIRQRLRMFFALFSVDVAPFKDVQGKVLGILAAARDVSDHRHPLERRGRAAVGLRRRRHERPQHNRVRWSWHWRARCPPTAADWVCWPAIRCSAVKKEASQMAITSTRRHPSDKTRSTLEESFHLYSQTIRRLCTQCRAARTQVRLSPILGGQMRFAGGMLVAHPQGA